jgi:hypothetical protein
MRGTDDLLIYLVAFVILAVIVAVLLVWVIVSAVKSRNKKPPSMQTAADPSPRAAPAAAPAVPEKEESPSDKEVLRVLRDMSSGTLYLEVDGRTYRNITDIRSPEVSRLVQQVAADMMHFARNVTPVISAAGAAPLNPHLGTPSVPVSPTAKVPSLIQTHDSTPPLGTPTPGSLARRGEALINPSAPARPAAEATPASGPAAPRLLGRTGKLAAGAEPPKKPTTGPLSAPADEHVDLSASKDAKPKAVSTSFWGRVLTSPNTTSGVAGPRPLADELEDVLQQLLHGLTKAPPFEVHFRTASDGGLRIDINGVSYPGIDAIEDPAAKKLVQIVVNKWEAG